MLQWRCNCELIMALTSANICSYLRTMPILDDDVVRMCPSGLIGCDNRGTKRGQIGSSVPRRTSIRLVHDIYKHTTKLTHFREIDPKMTILPTFWTCPMTTPFRLLQGVYICHVNDVLQIIDSYSRNRKSWRSRFPSWFVTCMTASWRNRPSRNIGESVFLIRLDDFGQISTNKNRSLRISDKYRINQYLSIY